MYRRLPALFLVTVMALSPVVSCKPHVPSIGKGNLGARVGLLRSLGVFLARA